MSSPTRSVAVAGTRRGPPESPRLGLIGGFELRDRAVIDVPLSAQRLLALLALHERPLQRTFVAGTLWLDSSEERATANLRTVLWRIPIRRLVLATNTHLQLAPDVPVDSRDQIGLARRVLGGLDVAWPQLRALCQPGELLPDWYDDWLLVERERLHQLRLQALEAASMRCTAARNYAMGIEAGLAAVAIEPLRETAHRALILVHLAQGNPAAAIRQYELFSRLLRDRLGLEPTRQLRDLVAPLRAGVTTT